MALKTILIIITNRNDKRFLDVLLGGHSESSGEGRYRIRVVLSDTNRNDVQLECLAFGGVAVDSVAEWMHWAKRVWAQLQRARLLYGLSLAPSETGCVPLFCCRCADHCCDLQQLCPQVDAVCSRCCATCSTVTQQGGATDRA